MPRLVLVGHAARGDDLVALDAAGGELLLVAASAVDLLLARDEGLGADGCPADTAAETLLVPLPGLVLHLLVAGPEDLGAAVAAGGELAVVAGAAVDLLHLAAELLVHQGDRALAAEEALLMPVLVFVRQILGIDADKRAAVVAGVGEDALVALGAVRVVVLQHVPLARERLVALPAAEVLAVPLLRHGLRVLAAEAVPLGARVAGLHHGGGGLLLLSGPVGTGGLGGGGDDSFHLLGAFLNGRHVEIFETLLLIGKKISYHKFRRKKLT